MSPAFRDSKRKQAWKCVTAVLCEVDNNRATYRGQCWTGMGWPLLLGCAVRNYDRLSPKAWEIALQNHLGELVKIALSHLYSLQSMIQKVKGGAPGGLGACGLLCTLWKIRHRAHEGTRVEHWIEKGVAARWWRTLIIELRALDFIW